MGDSNVQRDAPGVSPSRSISADEAVEPGSDVGADQAAPARRVQRKAEVGERQAAKAQTAAALPVARMALTLAGEDGGAQASERARAARAAQGAVGNTRVGGLGERSAAPSGMATKAKPSSKRITTPLGEHVKRNRHGAAVFDVGGVTVTVLLDKLSKNKIFVNERAVSARTTCQLNWSSPAYKSDDGVVSTIEPAKKPTLGIVTTYGPGASASSGSEYGRGTTVEDIEAGMTTLGFHEGNHGLDFLRYLEVDPVPQFNGKIGMTVDDYKLAMEEYDNAMKNYQAALNDFSLKRTDCVGTRADFCQDQQSPQ